MQYLTMDEVILIHEEIIRQYGGASLAVRDPGALDSALASPRQVVFDTELYPSLAEKAAILLFLLAKNHPFVDGNKRSAFLAMLRFIERNENVFTATNDEVFDLAIEVTTDQMKKEEIASWIAARLLPRNEAK